MAMPATLTLLQCDDIPRLIVKRLQAWTRPKLGFA